jgi:hypothetical protein
MRLIYYDQVVVTPVQGFEIDITGVSPVPAEISVAKDVVSESIREERVEAAVVGVDSPILAQLFGAQDEDSLILQFEVLDYRQSLICLTEPDAVRDDAAVMAQNLIDRPFDSVL